MTEETNKRHFYNEVDNKETNNIDLAYIAGLIEGEGCLRIAKEKPHNTNKSKQISYRPKIAVIMRDRVPIDFIVKHFPQNITQDKRWRYRVTYRTTQTIEIIKKISPFLTFKDGEAKTLLDLYETKLESWQNSPTEEFREYRHSLYLKCRELKKKSAKDYNVTSNINPPEQLLIPTDEELSYIAGIIDGEGSIAIYNHKNRNKYYKVISFSLSMNRLEPLLKIQKYFGGTILLIKKHFKINFRNGGSIPILKRLLPFLKLKHRQTTICLQFHETENTLSELEKQNLIKLCQDEKHNGWFGQTKPFKKIHFTKEELEQTRYQIFDGRSKP